MTQGTYAFPVSADGITMPGDFFFNKKLKVPVGKFRNGFGVKSQEFFHKIEISGK